MTVLEFGADCKSRGVALGEYCNISKIRKARIAYPDELL